MYDNYKPDGCIVSNVRNTVFGSKRAQLHHLLFSTEEI